MRHNPSHHYQELPLDLVDREDPVVPVLEVEMLPLASSASSAFPLASSALPLEASHQELLAPQEGLVDLQDRLLVLHHRCIHQVDLTRLLHQAGLAVQTPRPFQQATATRCHCARTSHLRKTRLVNLVGLVALVVLIHLADQQVRKRTAT